uniref:Uncharacterized protein n=1 Tax=Meloidogyne hapla TaxID=6305 RepID=A0A1I8BVE1_MELHA
MLPFLQSSLIGNTFVRILAIILLITSSTCLTNNQNLPTANANQIDSKLNEVEPLPIPQRNAHDDFEGSGVNPDDEDGDVEEGSGDGVEGSGNPLDDNERITTQTILDNVEEQMGQQKAQVHHPRTFKTDTSIRTEQPFSGSRVDVTKESTPTSTSTSKTKEIKTSTTTIKEKTEKERFPPEFIPSITTTTKKPTTTSTIKTTPKTTLSTTKSTKLPKQKMPPPPFIVDPTGTLEQLKPGVFARIGSYICEDHVQTHRYSNYYQKASTKEFYA